MLEGSTELIEGGARSGAAAPEQGEEVMAGFETVGDLGWRGDIAVFVKTIRDERVERVTDGLAPSRSSHSRALSEQGSVEGKACNRSVSPRECMDVVN